MRPLKFAIGLLLLPLCVSVTRTLAALAQALQPASVDRLPASFWWLIAGFSLWNFLYVALPRPMRTYVLGHELTHALWAWLMGGGVKKLKVSSKGGSVQVTKSNFLITLAPYFFPFYTFCTITLYLLLSLFFDQRNYEPFWLGCIGLTWAFHITFTLSMLKQRQPDIQEHGHLFSYVVIYILNILGVALWIVMVASPTLEHFINQVWTDIVIVFSWFSDWALAAWEWGQKQFG